MNALRRYLPPLASGILFGTGLTVGGMVDPVRVRGFLDLTGTWDPTLAFVMGGALIVMTIAWKLQGGMKHPIFAEKFSLPDRQDVDAHLVGGAALFGIGWGLAGICPGPALASLALVPLKILPFIGAMLLGMLLFRITLDRPKG